MTLLPRMGGRGSYDDPYIPEWRCPYCEKPGIQCSVESGCREHPSPVWIAICESTQGLDGLDEQRANVMADYPGQWFDSAMRRALALMARA